MNADGGSPVDVELGVEEPTAHRGVSDRLPLSTLAMGCVGRLLFDNGADRPDSVEERYLFDCRAATQGLDSVGIEIAAGLRLPAIEDRPLLDLAAHLELTPVEVLAVSMALRVEEEPLAGRSIAHVQKPVGGSRPTLGLVDSALRPLLAANGGWLAGALLAGNAIRCGLLDVVNGSAPIPEQALQVPAPLALALRGERPGWPGATGAMPSPGVPLPASVRDMSERHAQSLLDNAGSALLIRSGSRAEALAAAAGIAACLGREAIRAPTVSDGLRGLGVFCRLQHLVPVFEFDLAPGDTGTLPELAGYDGPCVAVAGPDGSVEQRAGSILDWTLPLPSAGERRSLWQAQLGEIELAAQLAAEHVHSAGRIAKLSSIARRAAAFENRRRPVHADVRKAALASSDGGLGALAQPLPAQVPDDALVLQASLRLELERLLDRCRCRETLERNLGVTIRARYQMGVRTLIVGPSGTGKTLAASWLATRLGLPLYRVDIASVTSKYIGETEKNLAKLLAKAEQAEVVLLFDEADSLFGKRTDIKDANDRFANSQTNYLLQRIESYNGIVMLTSNSRSHLDSAFTRRLDKIIEFPLPGPEERRALWRSHLGSDHKLTGAQFNQLAVSSDLCGGHIRNAVLTAAAIALVAERAIVYDDVTEGLASEYRKLGRQMPPDIRPASAAPAPASSSP